MDEFDELLTNAMKDPKFRAAYGRLELGLELWMQAQSLRWYQWVKRRRLLKQAERVWDDHGNSPEAEAPPSIR